MEMHGTINVGDSMDVIEHVVNLLNEGCKIRVGGFTFLQKTVQRRDGGQLLYLEDGKCILDQKDFEFGTIIKVICKLHIDKTCIYKWKIVKITKFQSVTQSISWDCYDDFSEHCIKYKYFYNLLLVKQRQIEVFYATVWEVIGDLIQEYELVPLIFAYVDTFL